MSEITNEQMVDFIDEQIRRCLAAKDEIYERDIRDGMEPWQAGRLTRSDQERLDILEAIHAALDLKGEK